jgi:hypothetical protein
MVSPAKISDQGQDGYQEILVKTKTSPKGLGAVRPAIKQHEKNLRFHLNAPLIKANKLIEENLAKSKPSPGRPRAVRPPP